METVESTGNVPRPTAVEQEEVWQLSVGTVGQYLTVHAYNSLITVEGNKLLIVTEHVFCYSSFAARLPK